MKKLLIGLSALLVLFFSGCTRAPIAPSSKMASPSKDSIAKSFKKDNKYSSVYLCRNTIHSGDRDIPVFVDGYLAGETRAYTFLHWKMEPGKHLIQSRFYNISSLTLNTKANTNYFIVLGPSGFFGGNWNIKIVEEEKGKKCILETKMLKSRLPTSFYK